MHIFTALVALFVFVATPLVPRTFEMLVAGLLVLVILQLMLVVDRLPKRVA